MRRAALVVLLLAACASPSGAEVATCDGSWRGVESRIVRPGGENAMTLAIECMRPVDDKRVRIGFLMPAGPTCYRLSEIEVVEAAEAVSFTLVASVDDNPAAGACPEDETRTATEIDLQAPVGERALLDGSRP
ncbi:MAG: hypothetical protein M3Y29_02145 [Chloroflexota bacterium]|nr:hypothetical protein [Chloroflexota bacterium]